jgi:hypothetical protein
MSQQTSIAEAFNFLIDRIKASSAFTRWTDFTPTTYSNIPASSYRFFPSVNILANPVIGSSFKLFHSFEILNTSTTGTSFIFGLLFSGTVIAESNSISVVSNTAKRRCHAEIEFRIKSLTEIAWNIKIVIGNFGASSISSSSNTIFEGSGISTVSSMSVGRNLAFGCRVGTQNTAISWTHLFTDFLYLG